MSDDTISRKAAIDALRRCQVIDVKNMLIAKDDVMKSIMTLPSAQQWIPVTERLPENGKYVLAYSADDDFMTVEARNKFEAFQITHWMPLPKPWKGENIDG